METLQVSLLLAKLTLQLLFLQTQVADAQTPVIASRMPPSVLLAPPGIESLTHYPELLKLENCESGGKYVVIIDVNGLRSYGWLQWQLDSFRRYGEKYGLIEKGKTNEELRELVKNRDLQFSIADKVLEDGGIGNWLNCARIQGLLPVQ